MEKIFFFLKLKKIKKIIYVVFDFFTVQLKLTD